MDENWAAVIVSLITGGFGLLGILATQFFAKKRTGGIKLSSYDIVAASEDSDMSARLSYLMLIKTDIKEIKSCQKEEHQDIKGHLRDIKFLLQEIIQKHNLH